LFKAGGGSVKTTPPAEKERGNYEER